MGNQHTFPFSAPIQFLLFFQQSSNAPGAGLCSKGVETTKGAVAGTEKGYVCWFTASHTVPFVFCRNH